MVFGRYDTFVIQYETHKNGACVAREEHTGLTVEGISQDEARSQLMDMLEEWEGSRPDPDEPVRTQETVRIQRR